MSLFLADKSAYEQQRHSDVADRVLRSLAADNALAMCEIVAMELLYSARGPKDIEDRRSSMQPLRWLHVTQAVMGRALDVQRALAARGQHRRPLPDIIVAATALEHDAVVLHYDHDFEVIATVTGLQSRWIIPRGTGHGRG